MWFLFALLAVLCWSVPIVLDSVLVKNFTRHPFVLMWTQSCISLVVLSVAVFFVDTVDRRGVRDGVRR